MRRHILPIFLMAALLCSANLVAHPLPPNPSITITPTVIDFGKVRVGLQRDTFFTITNTATAQLTLDSTRYQDFIDSANFEFVVDSLPGVAHLYKLIQNSVAVYVHFRPTQTGFFSIKIPIQDRQ